MSFRLSNALAALGVAFIMVTTAGCFSEECDGVSCPTGEVCEAGECVAEETLCTGKTCPAGTGCNLENGNCVNLCTLPTAPTCAGTEACVPETGTCADRCAGVTCESDTLECNPTSGNCERKCKPGICGAEYQCVPTTGECVKHCETATKPTGKAECGEGLKCQATSGECVPLCSGVTCGYSEWCVPDVAAKKGKCVGGKPAEGRPGSACENNADCFVDDAVSGQTFECRQDFPDFPAFDGGYCVASCGQSQQQCPQGSMCTGLGCLDQCTGNKDCRDGWMCAALGQGESLCFPEPKCSAADPDDCVLPGGDCSEDEDCAFGASCIAEIVEKRNPQSGAGTGVYEFSGFEGGYCLSQTVSAADCPPGSNAVDVGQGQFYCMKSCQVGELGECGLGESCWQLTQNSDAGGCWEAQCLNDADCNVAQCTAQDKSRCGDGQNCVGGSCSTKDKCAADGTCAAGLACDSNGECTGFFCEPASATCLRDVDCKTADKEITEIFEDSFGLECNDGTGRFERGCSRDDQCGANGMCVDSKCQMRCTLNNEGSLCESGSVCHEASGLCQVKCDATNPCAGDEVCDAGGHCRAACNAAVNPSQCRPDQACGTDGACTTRCTKSTENIVCKEAGTMCHVATGRCLPSCHDNEAVCGAEACSVTVDAQSNPTGVCGRACTKSDTCGTAPTGEALACLGAAGSKTCQFIACTDNTSSVDCGAELECVAGSCRIPTAPVCTVETEAADCTEQGKPFCDEVADECSAKCSKDAQCGEFETCTDAGACEAIPCNEDGAQACDGDDVCGPAGECQLSCAAAGAAPCEGGVVCDSSGLCGKTCDTAANCGTDLDGHRLTCNDDGGIRTCGHAVCEAATVDDDCEPGETCDDDDFCHAAVVD